jgi:murein DD-endopeptidase MepM/ murein hydrolase activator NlpD
MYLLFGRVLALLVGIMLYAQLIRGQGLENAPNQYSLVPNTLSQIPNRTFSDSVFLLRDSLETVLLRKSQTYQQVERLVASFDRQSRHLDLLPSVLPVDVPLESFRITSSFGFRRHPVSKETRFHGGVDVQATSGMIVKATAPGIVRQVGYDPALGAFVLLQHAFGFETIYGHLSGYCVVAGQLVRRNEEIGRTGKTGLVTGPHLHYVIKKNGSAVDPYQFCFLLRHRLWIYEGRG